MIEAYLGQIILVGFNHAPTGWVRCDGQLLNIRDHAALYALLGTTWGGDGVHTFAVPDLRGRVPVHTGAGPGLTERLLGEVHGAETVTLTVANLPPHAHALTGTTEPGQEGPMVVGQRSLGESAAMAIASLIPAVPFETISPFVALNFLRATGGVFPQRD